MAVATLVVRVSAQIAEFQKQFADTARGLDKFHSEFQGVATKAAAVGTFLGNVFTKLAGTIASGISSAIKDAIRLSSEFSNAFLGLGSVAAAFGQDVGLVAKAARALSSDGLLPLRDAATGLKNLLASGFNLDQSVQLMNAFKDSAAFGRQNALSFGAAVRSATEGVKNSNSILVDNAGITKNLSVILKEAGFSAQDLGRTTSDAGVRMALFSGLLKEASAHTGDAAKLSQTYTGAITRLSTAYDNLLARLGDAVTQNKTVAVAITALSNVFQNFITWLEIHGPAAFAAVSDAVIAFVQILSGVVKAIDFVQREFNILDTVIKTSVKTLADAVKAIGDLLINIAVLASNLPGSTAALKLAANQIRDLVLVTTSASDISRRMGSDIAANKTRMEQWGSALGGASTFLDTLATNLKETRGQTVSFGAAASGFGSALSDGVSKADDATKAFRKSLATLTGQIDQAVRTGTPLSKIVEEFGKAAADANDKASALGINVAKSVQGVAAAFKQGKIDEELSEFRQEVEKTHAATREAIRLRGLEQMEADAKVLLKSVEALSSARDRLADVRSSGLALQLTQIERARKAELASIKNIGDATSDLYRQQTTAVNQHYDHLRDKATGTFSTIVDRMRDLGILTRADLAKTTADAVRDYNQMRASGQFNAAEIQAAFERMNAALRAEGKETVVQWRKLFADLGRDLADVLLGGLERGDAISKVFADVARAVGAEFRRVFEEQLKAVGGDISKLSTSTKALGVAAGAIQAGFVGFELGQQFGKKGGALAGAAAGALAGSVVPGIGTAIGAGVGAIAGFFGGRAKEAKDRAAMEEARQQILAQAGGMAKLKKLAEEAGFSVSRLFDTKNPKEFARAVEDMNAAIARQKEQWEGLQTAVEGVNRRTAIFAQQFEGIGDKGKLAEIAQRTQEEFERLGIFVSATFGAMVRENGDAIGALNALAPSFEVLKKSISDFGLTSTGVIDELLANFDLLNNEAFKPFFERIQASGQILEGLDLAKALSPATFQALATDIGQSIQEIVNRGGDMARTLALSQPVLQKLWEAQQTYGRITDDTTQRILEQAEQQGLVGDHMKDVNQKILDVLIAIADVFGAKLPEGLRATRAAARDAASSISEELGRIKVPKIRIPVEVDEPRLGPYERPWSERLPEGVPTLAVIGARGSEPTIPLSQTMGRPSGDMHVTLEADGRAFAEVVFPYLPGEARRHELA